MNEYNSLPKISIITPSFNQGQFIEETILSVLNQTYKNIQYILVDGGSTDKTMDVVNKYRDKIDLIIHEKDKGQADAINKGFRLAKGELVGWINSDDLLYPECVKKIVSLYKQKNDGAIFYNCNLDYIDVGGNITNCYSKKIKDRNYLLNKKYEIIQQGSFYNRELVEMVNFLDEKLHYCMDLDLWLKLSKYGKIYFLDDAPFSAFRMWDDNKTNTGGKKFLKEIRILLKKNGANFFSKTILKTYWFKLKCNIKELVFR